MYLLAINGGVLFKPMNEKQAYYIESNYNAIITFSQWYCPESIAKYYQGYIKDDVYSYYFDEFTDNGIKLYYDLRNKKITKINNNLKDGLYKVSTNTNDTPNFGAMVKENHTKFLKELNKPLHIELIKTLKDIIKLKNEFVKTHNKNLDVENAWKTDIDVIKSNIETIALTIKTIPATQGSPLNAGLIINQSNTVNAKIQQLDNITNTTADYVEESNADLNDIILEIKEK